MPPIHSSTTSHLLHPLENILYRTDSANMLRSDRQKLGYPELKIFRTNQFDKPKYQKTQVSVYIDEPKYPKLK